MKEEIENEFGDKITNANLDNITKRIMLLPSSQIDEFWNFCGWSDSKKGMNMALPNSKLDRIKKDFKFAQKQIVNLFLETPKKQFMKSFNTKSTIRNKEKMVRYDTVKGFKDFTGEDAEKREAIRKVLVETFEKYGFEPAETPIVEYEEFVKGDNEKDEAVSDIFKLQDKGKRKLALRYELTFPLKRLMQNKKLPYKRYQIGPVFRDEPISANRFRQFTQCDVDVIGSTVKDEAEILAIAKEVLDKLGIEFIITINNRKLLNEILEDLGLGKNKEQILREIDKFGKIPEEEIRKNLKKLKAEKILDVLKKGERNYFSKFKGYRDVLELDKYCKLYGVEIGFTPMMVRGLSYYNGNIFEIVKISRNKNELSGSKETITAGGSYVFNNVQSTGISFGLDRLMSLAKVKNGKVKTLVLSIGQDREAIKLVNKLRENGESVTLLSGKPSKALEFANSKGFDNVVFVGEKEVKSGKFKIKDMGSGKERFLR